MTDLLCLYGRPFPYVRLAEGQQPPYVRLAEGQQPPYVGVEKLNALWPDSLIGGVNEDRGCLLSPFYG